MGVALPSPLEADSWGAGGPAGPFILPILCHGCCIQPSALALLELVLQTQGVCVQEQSWGWCSPWARGSSLTGDSGGLVTCSIARCIVGTRILSRELL